LRILSDLQITAIFCIQISFPTQFVRNAGNATANNRIGFSEIQFAGTKIPEPSSLLALLAFGLAGVSLGKRI